MALIVVTLAILSLVFWIVELIDIARREFPDPNNKIVWFLIVFFLHFIGALIYYCVGKPTGRIPGERPSTL